MRIAFLGDSITEGVPGVPYIEILQEKLSEHELVNFGKGGDTVSSLLKRIRKIPDLSKFDVFVLFVGVNDVFGKITLGYKILKTFLRQRWAKNHIVFESKYKNLLEYIQTFGSKIIVIPPLLLGENIENKWNRELTEYTLIIEKLINDNSDIAYLDIRSDFIKYLSQKEISGYLPIKLSELLNDVNSIKTKIAVDEKSKSRGLHLTLDGVHINTQGANIIANRLEDAITAMRG